MRLRLTVRLNTSDHGPNARLALQVVQPLDEGDQKVFIHEDFISDEGKVTPIDSATVIQPQQVCALQSPCQPFAAHVAGKTTRCTYWDPLGFCLPCLLERCFSSCPSRVSSPSCHNVFLALLQVRQTWGPLQFMLQLPFIRVQACPAGPDSAGFLSSNAMTV